ncbi:MAG: hypothetical protein U0L85_11360 [Bacilli bacterium]|nr:hypothetical protein [Bacilli bacterium]
MCVNKKIIIGGVVAVVVIVAGIAFMKLKSPSLKSALEEAKQCTSYTLESSMELLENDELKSYQVNVTYLKNENDYFKVELYDKSLNQSQVIVKNDDGVYVLTPTLNQAFKFQSEWPLNSPKPYIYQSLLDFLENNEYEKMKDGYLVSGEISYENDDRVASQEVKFDKDLNPVFINVYDKDKTEIMKLEVTTFSMNERIDTETFNEEEIMKTSQSQYSNVSSSLPLYPVALLGSTLQKEEVSKINDSTNHILQFSGEKSFTLVETVMNKSNSMNVEEIDGEVIALVDGFAYMKGNQMTYISSGVVCSLYSNELSQQEMLSVLSSMQSSSIK